ncbi:Na+/H+ antiporter subunit G [Rickettsia endosymbiont of Cardiosporidium cionae]|nr:Na+/H+ antiporter subunit G [Rickettsia endosymbiont of Cardiosporidium cionae]
MVYMIYLSYTFIAFGLFCIISSIIFLFRTDDFYNKLHGISVIDSFGTILCLLGLMLLQDSWYSSFKFLILIILIFLINPMSSYVIAMANFFQNRNK